MSELSSHPPPIVRGKGFLMLNVILLVPPGVNSAMLEKEIVLKPTIAFLTIPVDYGAASRRVEAPVDESPTSGHSNFTGSRMRGVQQWNNTSSSLANIGGSIHPQGNPIGVSPEVLCKVWI
ncbi:hypothetical protein O181_058742 [Austropuccinia psidii MF-1]|uniref:Uncharacterized protein n=1 Tax=Austropuccinia psidii MF-1 TaxID=1389203 RepID=A0A9Q3HWR1_9BASI|nr:hypothetical protein [Austropuccinia psidii MF-1]